MVAAEVALFAVLTEMNTSASDQLLLHLHEDFSWNDRLVAVLHIVLWHKTVILDALFRKEVNGVRFRGGAGGIRTHVRLTPQTYFESAPL